ncbi:PKD domain-containing protein [candidate division KSB1 bacterium]|nr:PKD domain-containing protein [candidate division KSB1 bacterium]
MKRKMTSVSLLLLMLGFFIPLIFGADAEKNPQCILVDFDAGPTVGPAPLFVRFSNQTENAQVTYFWNFGDGTTSTTRNPLHRYDRPGTYSVTLEVRQHQHIKSKTVKDLITVYADQNHRGLCRLKILSTSHYFHHQGWDQSIDGDTYKKSGTTTAGQDPAWAIYEFDDHKPHRIIKVRMLTDTGTPIANHWVKKFRVQVSMNGKLPTNFATVLEAQKMTSDWESFEFPSVAAKYVKLVIDEPYENWCQIGEFEVYEDLPVVDVSGSTLTATTPCVADSIDSCRVSIQVADRHGMPVTGLNSAAFRIIVSGGVYAASPVIETAVPGSYEGSFKSFCTGNRTVTVNICGTLIPGPTPALVDFTEPISELTKLEVVTGTECKPNQGWENLCDGDLAGPDGTTWAGPLFQEAWVILRFADDQIKQVNKLRFMTDTGHPYPMDQTAWYRVYISTAGTNNSEFRLVHEALTDGGGWEEFKFLPFYAKYIKLVLLEPRLSFRVAGEFEVYSNGNFGSAFEPLLTPQAEPQTTFTAVNTPAHFDLLQNYPNPFNPETQLRYQLKATSQVALEVYNILGQRIRTLVNTEQTAGYYQLLWDGKNDLGAQVGSGIYWGRLATQGNGEDFVKLIKMTLLR